MNPDSPAVWAAKKSGTEGGNGVGRHTPGPWGYVYNGSSGWSVGPADDPQAKPVCFIHERNDDLARSNARLIAAAPDMLEALTELRDVLRREAPGTPLNNHRFDALGIKVNAAIGKATGDES